MLILLTQVAVTVDPTQRTIRTSAAGREIRRHAPRCAVGKAAAATPTEAKGVKSAEDRHRSDEDQLSQAAGVGGRGRPRRGPGDEQSGRLEQMTVASVRSDGAKASIGNRGHR
jgi:hypothetical protein